MRKIYALVIFDFSSFLVNAVSFKNFMYEFFYTRKKIYIDTFDAYRLTQKLIETEKKEIKGIYIHNLQQYDR